jgi:hypothetical protein
MRKSVRKAENLFRPWVVPPRVIFQRFRRLRKFRMYFLQDRRNIPASKLRGRRIWVARRFRLTDRWSSRWRRSSPLQRTDECVCAALRRRRLRGTLQQTAARTSSLDGPVGDREALHLVEPPAKCFGIEIDCTIWVVGLDFKIDMTGFHMPIFSQQRVTPQLLAEF